ncbi:MAG: family 20 glycosylhydrolase [Ignavibacteriales bacterium]|nr:family 20 glycosylhydrolase [Ignavibacteriales bacterium]
MTLTFFKILVILVLSTVISEGSSNPNVEPEISIIPKPLSLKRDDGSFLVTKTTMVLYGGLTDVQRIAEVLASRLRQSTGYPIVVAPLASESKLEDAIIISLSGKDNLGPEGYQLTVKRKLVRIDATTPAGAFYGVQTLYQILPVEIEKNGFSENTSWSIPCVRIEDKPRFSWRGMHLDVGRHLCSKDSVKRYIDMIASYKMNTFHWHLTEDQGWRIEIKKYPRLTTAGAWRKETMGDRTPHGGFYSQDDVREIVEYARQHFITVVPEIEMPGHSQAALTAYPELSCSGGPFTVATEWGVFNDVYCAGNEKTFHFVEEVIDEVSALFPGPFFHIGGDECPKLRWSNCKRCQDRIAANGLNNEQELQSYFIKRVEQMLNARGKRLVGWDEILEGGLPPKATVMSWRGIQGGIEAAKSGHDVVMTPTTYCYFDYYQGVAGEPKAIGGFLPIDTVYAYEPVPSSLSPEESKHVLGAQGNVWTEWIPNYRQVEYMAATRMIALSEVVWTEKSQRNFKDFMQRMTSHYQRLGLRDINYRVPTPLGIGGRKVIFKDTVATISSPVPNGTIYYTLDGQDPTTSSLRYAKPIPIKGDQTLKAMLSIPGVKASAPITTSFLTVDPMVNGVAYNYFEDVWVLLPNMVAMKPLRSGRTFDLSLTPLPHRWEDYGFQFKCLIDLPSDGDYTFFLGSDDGSKLFLDDKLLINNDGLHGTTELNGKSTLTRGKHKLEVWYFQSGGASDLFVSLEGPGMPKQQIPPRMLTVQ